MRTLKPKLFIRADAFSKIGTGHIVGSLALASAWRKQGGEVIFATHCESERILGKSRKDVFNVYELNDSFCLQETIEIVNAESLDFVVPDGYQFGTDYNYKGYKKEIKDRAENILITMDGADIENYTSKSKKSLSIVDGFGADRAVKILWQ